MIGAFHRGCRAFASDRSGATAIEYALIAGAITIGLIAVMFTLGDTVAGEYRSVADAFSAI